MEAMVRQQIAFYGSTPAYAGVLEVLGEPELHRELHKMSRQGEWEQMSRIIPEHVVDACAVRASLKELPARLLERYARYYDRLVMYFPLPASEAEWVQTCAAAVRAAPALA